MDVQEVTAVFGAFLAVAGVIVWAIRLEGRINMVNQRVEQLERIAETQATATSNIAVMKNDIDHMKEDVSSMRDLLIALVPPSQRLKRHISAGD